MTHIFTNKFKIGDEVICVKESRYPEAYIQLGDRGTIIEIDLNSKYPGYTVKKLGGGNNEWCFMKENELGTEEDLMHNFLKERLKMIKQRVKLYRKKIK